MYTVFNKYTIKNRILPHHSKAKRGYVKSCFIEVREFGIRRNSKEP